MLMLYMSVARLKGQDFRRDGVCLRMLSMNISCRREREKFLRKTKLNQSGAVFMSSVVRRVFLTQYEKHMDGVKRLAELFGRWGV